MLCLMTLREAAEPSMEDELTELYNAYAGKMLGVARVILGSQSLAEEAVQEAFLRVIKNFQKFLQIPCQKRGAWFVIIVRNISVDILRRERRELPLEENTLERQQPRRPAESGDLAAAIAALPAIYRDTLTLRYSFGYSNAELADMLGISMMAAAQRVSRAKKCLRDKLSEQTAKKKPVNNPEGGVLPDE